MNHLKRAVDSIAPLSVLVALGVMVSPDYALGAERKPLMEEFTATW